MDERSSAISELFTLFDLDGNGVVGLNELQQVIQTSDHLSDRAHKKYVAELQAYVRQGREMNARLGFSSQVHLRSGGTINFFGDAHGEPSLDPDAFAGFIKSLTQKDSEEEFERFCENARKAVVEARSKIAGTEMKQTAWDIFQQLDANRDGHVDYREISLLFEAENRNDKKTLSRWAAILSQRQHQQEQEGTSNRNKSPDPTAEDDEPHLLLTLSDFQHFMEEYTEGNLERARAISNNVQTLLAEKHKAYAAKMKLGEVFDAIMADLLRERPNDVLDGIIKSAERLKRTGRFPKQLYRSGSVSHVEVRIGSNTDNAPPPTQ